MTTKNVLDNEHQDHLERSVTLQLEHRPHITVRETYPRWPPPPLQPDKDGTWKRIKLEVETKNTLDIQHQDL